MLKKYFLLFIIITSIYTQDSTYQVIATSDKYISASIKNQIFIFHNNTQKWKKTSLKSFDTVALCFDNKDHLWLLLSRKIIRYSITQNKEISIPLPKNFEYIPPSIFVHVGIIYWKKKIWIAANEKLWCYFPKKQSWSNFFYYPRDSGGQISIGPNDRLWLKGNRNFDGKKWYTLPKIPTMGEEEENIAFTFDYQGCLWTINKTNIYFFSFSQKKWKLISQNLSRPTAIVCFQDDIWVCDYGSGVFKLISKQWVKIENNKKRPNLNYASQILATNKQLWVNTYFGIGSFNSEYWVSHFDDTQHNSITELFYLTLGAIILLLLVSIIMLFILNRMKKINYEKTS